MLVGALNKRLAGSVDRRSSACWMVTGAAEGTAPSSGLRRPAISKPRPKVAVVVSHPIQHFCPLYRGLTADGRLRLMVFFASTAGKTTYFDPAFSRDISWGSDVTDGFDHEFLPGADFRGVAQYQDKVRLRPRLDSFDPDVVQFYGYRRALSRQTLGWAVRRRRASLMVADSELLGPRSRAVRALKAVVLPPILRLPTAYLTIGDENERYYRTYGVSASRLWRSPIPIDSALFDDVLRDRGSVRPLVRKSWGVAETDIVLLAVGKTVPRKSHEHVVRAVAQLAAADKARTVAVFAGGGPSSDVLTAEANSLGVRVVLAGFLPVSELARAYQGADVLVHPSSADPHPLAVAEAVYSGLPVIVSDRVGSWGQTDDVRPRQNGLRYPYGDTAALSQAVCVMLRDEDLRRQYGVESSKIGRARDMSASVNAYVEGVAGVLRLRGSGQSRRTGTDA